MLQLCIEYAVNKMDDSRNFINFCFMIYIIHNKTYQILNGFIPLIPDYSYREMLSPERNLLKESITDINFIDNIITDAITYTPITLSGDATSIKPFGDQSLSSMYTYIASPLSKECKSNTLHVCPCNSGTSSNEIVDKFSLISQKLERKGYEVKFWATDGDKAFDSIHHDWFQKFNEIFSLEITFS